MSEEGRADLRGLRVMRHQPLPHSPPRESISVVLGQHFFNRTTDVTQTFGIEKYIPYPLYSVFNPSDHDLGEAPPEAVCWEREPGRPGGVLSLSREGWERRGLGEGGGREKVRGGRLPAVPLRGLTGHSPHGPAGGTPCDSGATFGCHGPPRGRLTSDLSPAQS